MTTTHQMLIKRLQTKRTSGFTFDVGGLLS
jgi:hypothetical protein